MIYREWERLPGKIVGRWAHIRPVAEICFTKGLTVLIPDDEAAVAIHFDDWRELVFGGRGATYLPFERRMYVTLGAALGLDSPYHVAYRPDIHEWGHAVWSLVLKTTERWLVYYPAWIAARAAGRLLNEYSATKPEEGFAEDFEAILREDFIGDGPWEQPLAGRGSLRAMDEVRYNGIKAMLYRRGLVVGD